MENFEYSTAFARNIGLLTTEEQQKIRSFTVAIPGMGGVGGVHMISMIRQGFEKFKIADIDTFELKNFNRQYGARIETIGQEKVVVMQNEALKINPNCQITTYTQGITPENIDDFLENVDIAIDSIDAFEVDTRRMFINKALEKNIPVISAAPIGFGTAFLIFMPGGPNFDKYFDINEKLPYTKKLIRFFVGLIPSMLQRSYMHSVNLEEKRGPSSIGAVNLCAGVATINAVKVLLKKGKIHAVPYYHQFDVMRDIYVVKKLYFGNKNPIQKIKFYLAHHLAKD